VGEWQGEMGRGERGWGEVGWVGVGMSDKWSSCVRCAAQGAACKGRGGGGVRGGSDMDNILLHHYEARRAVHAPLRPAAVVGVVDQSSVAQSSASLHLLLLTLHLLLVAAVAIRTLADRP
jgi:hypothetical protein